jgi:hypothetical protein
VYRVEDGDLGTFFLEWTCTILASHSQVVVSLSFPRDACTTVTLPLLGGPLRQTWSVFFLLFVLVRWLVVFDESA